MIEYVRHRSGVMAQPGHTGDVLWDSVRGLASAINLVSEMLSDEPGSVSYSKLVRLDVVRCPRLNRQVVTESRAKEKGTLVVSHT